jgi:hypothetical protein
MRTWTRESEGPHGGRACAAMNVGATEAKSLDQEIRRRDLGQSRRGWARVELNEIEIPGHCRCRKLIEIAELPAQQLLVSDPFDGQPELFRLAIAHLKILDVLLDWDPQECWHTK